MGADHNFAVSVENYLKTMWHLEQRSADAVSNRDLAEILQITRPSVSQMITKLEKLGFVKRVPQGRGYRLSAKGNREALKLLRAHRLVEMFLTKSLGLEGVFLHHEAERLEHAVSERLLAEIDRYLGYPEVDFAGAPIPRARGAGELPEAFSDNRDANSRLSKVKSGHYRVARVHDDSAKLLEFLDSHQLKVGSLIEVQAVAGRRLKVHCEGNGFVLSTRDASSIEVWPA